jgi:hypothetical protein
MLALPVGIRDAVEAGRGGGEAGEAREQDDDWEQEAGCQSVLPGRQGMLGP